MPDSTEATEKNDPADAASSDKARQSAVDEAKEGQKDLSKSVADYYQARRSGLRDRDTFEHLPPPPTFFDSSRAKGPAAEPEVREATSSSSSDLSSSGGLSADTAVNFMRGFENHDRTDKTKASEVQETRTTDKFDTAAEKERLNKALDSHLPAVSQEKKDEFHRNMEAFEKRAKEQHLPADEVAKTYRETSRLLDATGDQPLKPEDRARVAEQVMQQAAHPTHIDQGQHMTCNVAVVETMMYSKCPSAAAKLVADVGTTGEYTAGNGTHVKLNSQCLKPDGEARKDPPESGDRTFASQLFQTTAINLYYKKNEPNVEYRQLPNPVSDQSSSRGEQLVDISKNPPQVIRNSDGTPKDFSGFATEHVAQTYNAISGKENFDVGLAAPPFDVKPVHATAIETEKKLEGKLADLKKDGKLPVAVWVHTANEPFWSDAGHGAAGGSGGDKGSGHYVTITDYHAGPPSRVEIDNQWGESHDHQWHNPDGTIDPKKGISTHDMFRAMHDPADARELLRKDVMANRKNATIDTAKEADLLRMEKLTSNKTDEQYAKELAFTINEAKRRWKTQKNHEPPTFDQDEHDRGCQKLSEGVNSLPADQRLKVLAAVATSDVMSSDDCDQSIQKTALALLQEKADKINKGKWNAGEQAHYKQMHTELGHVLANLPPERREAILKQILAKAPAGAHDLT